MRTKLVAVGLLLLLVAAACKPGGVQQAHELCAKAAAMYEQCESRDGLAPLTWDLVLDRWRSLCRAAITGETKQLLPDALGMWTEMPDDVKAGLRVQAECAAATTTCAQYRACEL
ncbi:MAG: hypothetical protein M3680_08180 [Myxococcota bacterium]|nr:hypothetical protein [Myxococcota bacterium]